MTLMADQKTELHARIEGYVREVHVDIGDRVEMGQTLVTLDAPELEAEVRRREQMVRQAEANLSVAKGAVLVAQAKLRQAGAARDEQAALKQLRTSERDRYALLVQGGAVQKEKLDEAQYALLAVEAAVTKIEADVSAAEAAVAAAKNEVEFASSGIEVAKAQLAHAVAQDQLRQIRAPFAGLITSRSVDPGRLVSQNAGTGSPLLVIEKVDTLRGVVTVPAAEASQVNLGDAVTLSQFANADKAAAPDGGALRVSRIGQSLSLKTRTMRVEVDIQNKYDESTKRYPLLSGQYGSATIKTNTSR